MSIEVRRFVQLMAVMLLSATLCQGVRAEVIFYVQRHGSEEDDGEAQFKFAVGDALQSEDFEDAKSFPNGAEVEALDFGKATLSLSAEYNGTLIPFVFSSSGFDVPDEIFGQALFIGSSVTMTPDAKTDLYAVGSWFFDDTKAFDSGVLMEVVEYDGTVWSALLVNEIPLNSKGHEIEGFIGAVSDVGIESVTFQAVDPVTLTPIPDGLEMDHLRVSTSMPPSEDAESPPCGQHPHGDKSGCKHGHHGPHHQWCGHCKGDGKHRDSCPQHSKKKKKEAPEGGEE